MSTHFRRGISRLNSTSIKNVGYVSGLQAATLLVPIVTLPWILRALGPAGYGKYALAIAIGQYATIFVEFGFDLSAVQRIATLRDDKVALTRYFWTVQSIRTSFAISAASCTMAFVSAIPKFHPIIGVTASYLPALLGTVLYPQWLFIGLERIKVAAVINIISRLASVVPLLVFVHTPDDCARAAFIAASFLIIGGILSSVLIFHWRLVGRPTRPRICEVREVLKNAWSLFTASVAVTLFASLNTVVLGLVSTNTQVGIFNAATRIRQASQIPFSALSTVYMPKLARLLTESRQKTIELNGRLAVASITLGFCISAFLYSTAPFVVQTFMGTQFDGVIPVLRALSFLPIISAFNNTFCAFALIPFGLTDSLSKILWISGVLNIAPLTLLAHRQGAIGAAVSVGITETFLVILMGFTLHRHGLLVEIRQQMIKALRVSSLSRLRRREPTM